MAERDAVVDDSGNNGTILDKYFGKIAGHDLRARVELSNRNDSPKDDAFYAELSRVPRRFLQEDVFCVE